jgi:uncharacterized protein (DUF2147 family)
MTRSFDFAAVGLAALATLSTSSGAAVAEPSPFGLWARGDGKARVRIERCGSDLCAVNTWIREGTKGEKAGDRLVMSVAPAGAGRWTGTAFDPQRDMSYRLTMAVRDASMTTRGCVLAGLLCKDMAWTRLSGE